MRGFPGYWQNETSGVLFPVMAKFIQRIAGVEPDPLTVREISLIRLYLKQWMNAGAWQGAEPLSARIDSLYTEADLRKWIDDALDLGIDPL